MSNPFKIDYSELDTTVIKKQIKLSKEQVKANFTKVAFDVFTLNGSDPDMLWEISQDANDGAYIVAKYDDSEIEDAKKTAVASSAPASRTHFTITASATSSDLNVHYKGFPLTKIASVKKEEVQTLCSFLPNKLATDKSFLAALLNTIDEDKLSQIKALHPELF